jgi:acetyltransferase-like isoleucine patch superfamily enzyme
MKIYDTVKITPRTELHLHNETQIGDYTFIGCRELHMEKWACISRYCELQGRGAIYMGQGAQIASYTQIITSTDTPAGMMSDLAPEELRRVITADVTIGKDAYIGPQCTVMPGVKIGEGAVIGRGLYIDKEIPPWVMVLPTSRSREVYFKKRRIDDDLIKPVSGVGFKRYTTDNVKEG